MRRVVHGLLVATLTTMTLVSAADPAQACLCTGPGNLRVAIDESRAAFVGTVIEKRDSLGGGLSASTGRDVTYVFDVEKWIKGDLGPVIEVHSPADDGSCGLQFRNADNRVGAFIWVENGEIHSGLCSQVDPDRLLAASLEAPRDPTAPTVPPLLADRVDTSVPRAVAQSAWWLVIGGSVAAAAAYLVGRQRKPSGEGDEVE